MSDLPQGSGWWRASDGLYYPPEARPATEPGEPAHAAPASDDPLQAGQGDRAVEPSLPGAEPSPPGDAGAGEPTVLDHPPVDPTAGTALGGDPYPASADTDPTGWDDGGDPPDRPRALLPVILLVVALALAAGAATWFVLAGDDEPDTVTTTTEAPDTDPTTTTEAVTTTTEDDGQISAFDLAVGDCFDTVEVDEGDGLVVNTVQLLDCDQPHQAEAFSIGTLDAGPDEEFPGNEGRDEASQELCMPRFEEFVGGSLAESDLLLLWLAPTAESWADGDREVVCIVAARDGQTLTGTSAGVGADDTGGGDEDGDPGG